MRVTGHAAATKIGQGSTASGRGRSQGGVGILEIVGIRAGDLRDSTVPFGAHPCPTIATAVQPGMFRSNQNQSVTMWLALWDSGSARRVRIRNAKVEGSIPFRSISPPSMAVHESALPLRARQGHPASLVV